MSKHYRYRLSPIYRSRVCRSFSGFTLVELVLSLGIMSILMTGLASAILIASHAIPGADTPSAAIVRTAEVADLLAEELRTALWVREHTATSVEFSVPDRDGDGLPERVRYSWGGADGDPLTRQYNGGTVVDVLDVVRDFDLEYETESTTEVYPGPPVESGEVLLSSCTSSNSLNDYTIEEKKWYGQYFEPATDPNALSWRVTRVLIEAKDDGPDDGHTLIQLRTADGSNLPTDTVLEEQIMYEKDLSGSYTWQQFEFTNVAGLTPGDGLCLVCEYGDRQPPCKIRYENTGGYGSFYTADAGQNWSMYVDNEIRHYIYGTRTYPSPPQTAVRNYLNSVRIVLRTSSEADQSVVTSAQTLNTPELLAGLWEADFNSDPTLDHNGDGTDDWSVRDGSDFTLGTLVSRVTDREFEATARIVIPSGAGENIWEAYSRLDTEPTHTFKGLTTAIVRFRNPTVGSDGAAFMMRVDETGSDHARIETQLQLQADGTQNLVVLNRITGVGWITLMTANDLSGDFVTVRLLIDPDLDTVNVQADGQDYGTYTYGMTGIGSYRGATLNTGSGDAEFDYVSIRVGE